MGVFFGFAHIISGEAWSAGKFAQATASGIIIGWVYFRHGLAPAILIHWAANYFIFSYAYIISDVSQITVDSAFEHSLLNTLEMMLLAIGIISVAIFTLNRLFSKRNILHT